MTKVQLNPASPNDPPASIAAVVQQFEKAVVRRPAYCNAPQHASLLHHGYQRGVEPYL